jgi:hypothetical protein
VAADVLSRTTAEVDLGRASEGSIARALEPVPAEGVVDGRDVFVRVGGEEIGVDLLANS